MLAGSFSSQLKVLCLLAVFAHCGSLSAKIYKCTDAQGKVTFGDKPCDKDNPDKEQTKTQSERDKAAEEARKRATVSPQSPTEIQKGFFQSLEYNEAEKFSALLSKNAYLANIRDQDGRTPLYVACRNANFSMVQQLIAAGANPKATTSFGDAPLFALAMIGEDDKRYSASIKITDYLLANGASIYAEDGNGDNILHKASFYGNVHLAQLALKNGISPHMRDHNRSTPIYQAAWTGNKSIIEALLKYGANIDADIEIGQSPIYGAAWTNKLDVAQFLVAKGAQISKKGRTPLHLAATHGNIEVSEYFVEQGVSVDALDDSGTPLHQAAWTGKVAYIEWLKSKGANLNSQNSQGETPLHVAVKWDKVEAVKSLLKLGADPAIKNINGETVKDLASKSNKSHLNALFN